MERREQVLAHAVHEIAAIDEILLAQREQVTAVAPFGRRRQAQQELRAEIGDQLAVGHRGGVVELVDDEVVEGVRREALQMFAPAERLDRGEYDFGIRILDVAGVVPEPRIRADAAERVERLVQNLFPVRREQHAAELRPARVERREPGLAEPCRQDDQARLVAGGPSVLQRSQGRLLHNVRLHGRLRSLPVDIRGFDDGALDGAALAIALDPRSVEQPGVRVGEQFLEREPSADDTTR